MIIQIKAGSTKYQKRIKDFCNQIAYGNLQPIDQIENEKQNAKYIKQAQHIKKDLMPMTHRQNQDVSQVSKNEIRELIKKSWTAWKDTWCIPESEDIKVSFPTEIKDSWQEGKTYYIFMGAYSENRVIQF